MYGDPKYHGVKVGGLGIVTHALIKDVDIKKQNLTPTLPHQKKRYYLF